MQVFARFASYKQQTDGGLFDMKEVERKWINTSFVIMESHQPKADSPKMFALTICPVFIKSELHFMSFVFCLGGSHGPTVTWWGCCGLCQIHKPTELSHSFSFCSCIFFCLYGPFNCISFHKFSRQLSAFSSVLPVLFLPHWSFQMCIFFMRVSFSPDIILCGWLRLKHQRTTYLPN